MLFLHIKDISMIRYLLLLAILISFTSCSRTCYHYDIYGADEFVMDSYKIRQGKLSILELEGTELGEISSEMMEEYTDVIAEDDILNIAVYHPKRRDVVEAIQFINKEIGFKVTNGSVNFPDIPPIEVEGLTLEEARIKIQNSYQEQIQDMEIFLTYRDRLSRKVELTGAVATPVIAVDGKMRLYEILAKAHVPNNANFFKSYVVRDGCQLPVDLHRLINEGDMCQNIVVRGGDKIFIAAPSDSNVMVMGEVNSPRAVPVPYGFVSIKEAIVAAGGIPFTGSRDCIQVIRGNLLCPKIYVLSWDHIVHLPNDSMLLMPGDTVFVSEKPITQWNRFIDQLLPSCAGIQNAYGVYTICND